ncbi:FitA-like ribbon-helix-helix domain-containing protein [Terrarubrum flagellatum]|uniref:FitA-like ribbon-helix-helix domain-containing protein n=1 Tax=Terrirubrum flagellatum TaxID=2895980 RepID=UPI003144EB35
MSDILIHDVDPALKALLEARARAAGHSLSDEAKALLEQGLGGVGRKQIISAEGIGTQLSKLIPPELWTDDFIVEREKIDRPPPDFS